MNPHLLNYLDTWDKIDSMLEEILSQNFRNQFLIPKIMVGYIIGLVLIMYTIILIQEEEI